MPGQGVPPRWPPQSGPGSPRTPSAARPASVSSRRRRYSAPPTSWWVPVSQATRTVSGHGHPTDTSAPVCAVEQQRTLRRGVHHGALIERPARDPEHVTFSRERHGSEVPRASWSRPSRRRIAVVTATMRAADEARPAPAGRVAAMPTSTGGTSMPRSRSATTGARTRSPTSPGGSDVRCGSQRYSVAGDEEALGGAAAHGGGDTELDRDAEHDGPRRSRRAPPPACTARAPRRTIAAVPAPAAFSSASCAARIRSRDSPIVIDVMERIPLLGVHADRRLDAAAIRAITAVSSSDSVDRRMDLEDPRPTVAPAGHREDHRAGGRRQSRRHGAASNRSPAERHNDGRTGLGDVEHERDRPAPPSARNSPRADCRTVKISRPFRCRESLATISVIPGDTTGAITVLRCNPRPSDALAAMSQLPKCGSTTIEPRSPTLRCSAPITRNMLEHLRRVERLGPHRVRRSSARTPGTNGARALAAARLVQERASGGGGSPLPGLGPRG